MLKQAERGDHGIRFFSELILCLPTTYLLLVYVFSNFRNIFGLFMKCSLYTYRNRDLSKQRLRGHITNRLHLLLQKQVMDILKFIMNTLNLVSNDSTLEPTLIKV